MAAAFEPENDLERRLAEDPVMLRGLAWGEPRTGTPRARSGAHVTDLLRTLDEWGEPEPRRSELRFLALVHDALKYRVRSWLPKTGENHHAMRARRLAERYTSDERLLAAIELHDRPYAIWRRTKRGSDRERARRGRAPEANPRPATCSCASSSSTARTRARTRSRSRGCAAS